MYTNEGPKQSPTFGYWFTFLNGADLLLRMLCSEREADFQLQLNCMCEFMPWFRAAGRTNYAKYMSVYVAEMKSFEHEQPEAYTFMQQGGLLIRHWSKPSTEKARVRVELLASHYGRELSQDG